MFCISLASMAATPAGPFLLPASGLYGLPEKTGNDIKLPLPAHIHDDFLTAIGYKQGAPVDAINWIQSEVKRLFGTSVIDTVTMKNKFRTYAVSLQVTRADQYSVDKEDGNTDVYLPLGINIFFTNIITGEVLYSASKTAYTNLTETQDNYRSGRSSERIQAAYRENLKEVLTSVLTEASAKFKPLQISARVVDDWKGYLILDKGVDVGIAAGQEMLKESGEGFRILYSGKTYSVGGSPDLGEIKEGDEVSFFSTASASDVKKPRVLIIDADSPSDILGSYASTQFAEELGAKASFTIIPVNPNFSKVLHDVASNQGLRQDEVTQNRELPNYFLRLKVLQPVVYELVSNQSFGKQRVFEGSAFAELLDKTGRVLYATEVHEEIRDTIVSNGMAFDLRDRQKILYGNLLKTLSEKFIKDVRFSRNELSIQKVTDEAVVVNDQAGLLVINQNARVMHKLKKYDGIQEVVLVPTWDLNVVERSDSAATLQRDLPTQGKGLPIQAHGDDLVVVESSSGKNSQSRLSFSLCDESQDIGTIKIPELKDLAYFSIGKVFQQPFFGGDYPVSANHKGLAAETASFDQYGFKKADKPTAVTPPPYCLSPLIKVTETSRKCAGEGSCDVTLNIIAGIQVLSADKVKGPKKILSVDYKISNAPENGLDLFVKRKVLLKAIELFPEVLKQLDVSKL